MKKILSALLIALLAGVVFGASVSESDALTAAQKWMAENRNIAGDIGYATGEAIGEYDSNKQLLWWTVATSGGSVFIAPDTGIEPVISVLKNYSGSIPANHPLRALLAKDMTARLAALNSGRSLGKAFNDAKAAAEEKWARYLAPARLLTKRATIREGDPDIILGLVDGFEKDGRFTHWDQSAAYNLYSPNGYPCGCVAVSAAAVLQCLNVTAGPGRMVTEVTPSADDPDLMVTNLVFTTDDSYTYTYGCVVDGVQTDLTSVPGKYDWTILPKAMGGTADNSPDELTDDQKDLLSRATYNAGIAFHMDYTKSGSGTMMYWMSTVLRNHFGLADARYVSEPGVSEYDDLIYSQLRCGRPVLLGILGNAGGHAIVATGFGRAAGTDYTRLFLGWAGAGDAWYALPNIDCGIDDKGNPTGVGFDVIDEIITMLGTDTKTMPLYGSVRDVGGVVDGAKVIVPAGDDVYVTVTANGGNWALLADPADFERGAYSNKVYWTVDDITTNELAFTVGDVLFDKDNLWSKVPYPFQGVEYPADIPAGKLDSLTNSTPVYGVSPSTGLSNALPDFMLMLPGNWQIVCDRKEAKRIALEQNKAILMVSGKLEGHPEGDEIYVKSGEIYDYLAKNHAAIEDHVVLCIIDYSSSIIEGGDGSPSVGVFSSYSIDDDSLDNWAFYNGRLSYADKEDFDESASVDAIMDDVIDTGLTEWNARVSNNKLTITGMLDGKINKIGADVFPEGKGNGYGVYTDMYGSNVTVVTEAPAFVTNKTASAVYPSDLIYRNDGWVVTDAGGNVIESGSDSVASFEMDGTNLDWTLTWNWKPHAVYVDVNFIGNNAAASCRGIPGSGWYAIGEVADIIVIPENGKKVDGAQGREWIDGPSDIDNIEVNGTHLSFVPVAPSEIYVSIEDTVRTTDKINLSVVTDSSASEIAAAVPQPLLFGDAPLEYGVSTNIFSLPFTIQMPSGSVTDENGDVWNSIGWVLTESETGTVTTNKTPSLYADVVTTFADGTDVEIAWLWEKQVKPVEPEEPGDVTIKPEDLVVSWDDNPKPGDNVIVKADALPEDFGEDDIASLTGDMDSLNGNLPAGWVYGEPALKITEDGLVANLELDTEALNPKPVEGKAVPLEISVVEGKVVLTGAVANGVEGFWYSIHGSNNVNGPYKLVGTPKQADAGGRIDLTETVNPTGALQFYKIIVDYEEPAAE